MPVVCPGCGTTVAGGAKVCPACHYRLAKRRASDTNDVADEERWCGSCGSPIPAGHDACPECGMPTDGTFDEDAEPVYAITKPLFPPRKKRDIKLVSAIPPTPKSGEKNSGANERRRRVRLLLFSAIAATVLVGGTTLFITRPWDPQAYSIHATEDADTSMEGFPGERTYLSSQDLTKENEFHARALEQRQHIDQMYARMGELAADLQSSYDDLVAYGVRGAYTKDESQAADASAMRTETADIADEFSAMELVDTSLEDRRSSCAVLSNYLSEAAAVLADAWNTSQKEEGSLDTTLNVQSVLAGEKSDHSFEQWMQLFQNAYRPSATPLE